MVSVPAAARGKHGPGEDPLQQEGRGADARGGARLHPGWGARPVPVPELRPGSGGIPGPL